MSLATSAHQAFAERVEERLEQAVATDPGAVARAGAQTLRSGGKRLRPLLVSMCATDAARGRDELVGAGCAVELVHMATLVHDDVLDAAPLRRGHPTVWRTDGRGLATATGDHLFARAFAELTATGDMPAVAILADACLGLARGEILQRHQAGDPSVTVDGYLERCTLKTGRLFSAAARLGARFSQLPQTTRRRWAASPRRWAWPSRSPTTCSTATATPTPPASRSAPTCWTALSRCRCWWPPAVTRRWRP